MTVSSLTVKNSYSGNGSNAKFTYTFPIHSTSELSVIIRSSTGVETTKNLTTHYTINDNGSAGGTVIFTAGNIPASGETVVLIRSTNLTQETDYIANDPFPAETHEAALDKLVLQVQELQEELDRALKISRTNTITSSEITTSATDRASKVLSFNTAGEILLDQELGEFKGNWAASTTYAARSLVKDSSNNNIYLCNTAHTSSGSTPISSNADVAKWDLLVDAAAATTSATAAAASEANALTYKNAALAAQSAAETAETNAETAETAAETAETAAEAAQAAAELAQDQFDDAYLGSKTTDPTTDNDGDALTEGDMYYNSSSNMLKIYSSSVWKDAAVDTTGFAQSGFAIAMSVAL